MDGRCKTCKHWDQSLQTVHYHVDTESKVIYDPRFGVCVLTDLVHTYNSDRDAVARKEKMAMALDKSEYSAFLVTREDFGCIQYERKPDAQS